MILKMNFNFNFKDMPFAAGQSIRRVTSVRDWHHMAKYGIKRFNLQNFAKQNLENRSPQS